jgi:hypothetical protein
LMKSCTEKWNREREKNSKLYDPRRNSIPITGPHEQAIPVVQNEIPQVQVTNVGVESDKKSDQSKKACCDIY